MRDEQTTCRCGLLKAASSFAAPAFYAALVDDCQIIMDKIDSLRGCVDTTTERGLQIEEAMCRARNYMMEARNDCSA